MRHCRAHRNGRTLFATFGSRILKRFRDISKGILGTINSELAIERGLTTAEELGRWNKALLTWQDDPGALGGYVFGKVIGRKP